MTPRPSLLDAQAALAELHRILAQPSPHGLEQHLVQIGAVDGKLRPVVAGEAPARLLVDELAVTAVVAKLARLDRAGGELVGQPQLREFAHGMRQEVDADAERQHLGRRLDHAAGDAGLVEAERQDEPADPAAHDQDIGQDIRRGVVHSGRIPRHAKAA